MYVNNVAETLEFYCRAFGLKQKMLHPSGDYGELETGGTLLSFSSLSLMRQLGKHPQKAIAKAPSFEIAFETENVAQALSLALEQGAELIQAVEEMPWGQTTAYVNDINGFLVEICSPINLVE